MSNHEIKDGAELYIVIAKANDPEEFEIVAYTDKEAAQADFSALVNDGVPAVLRGVKVNEDRER